MPTIQRERLLAAGINDDNLWSGSAFEYMRNNGVCSAAVVASVLGAFVTIQSGPDIILEEATPFILAAFPIVPDHFYYNWAAAAGDRLLCRLRNPTAGNVTFRSVLNIQYAA
jgi:hypothetical protein